MWSTVRPKTVVKDGCNVWSRMRAGRYSSRAWRRALFVRNAHAATRGTSMRLVTVECVDWTYSLHLQRSPVSAPRSGTPRRDDSGVRSCTVDTLGSLARRPGSSLGSRGFSTRQVGCAQSPESAESELVARVWAEPTDMPGRHANGSGAAAVCRRVARATPLWLCAPSALWFVVR